jgi:hypothetical protein
MLPNPQIVDSLEWRTALSADNGSAITAHQWIVHRTITPGTVPIRLGFRLIFNHY